MVQATLPGTLDELVGALRLIEDLDAALAEAAGVLTVLRDELEGSRTRRPSTLLWDTREALRLADRARDQVRLIVKRLSSL